MLFSAAEARHIASEHAKTATLLVLAEMDDFRACTQARRSSLHSCCGEAATPAFCLCIVLDYELFAAHTVCA